MSGANYAYCDHCNTKAFYDAETDIGDAAVFHGKCLPAHDAAVAAKALRGWIKEWPTTPDDGTFLADVARDGRTRADRIEREAGESGGDA